jgi:CBS domain containing-hemolysin-like protein
VRAHPVDASFDTCLLVTDSANTIAGVVPALTALRAIAKGDHRQTLGQMAAPSYIVVRESDSLLDIIGRMRLVGATVAVVADRALPHSDHVKGIITKELFADAMVDATDLFAD